MPTLTLKPETTLPSDGTAGALAGRVWRPDLRGPSVVAIRADGVHDISAAFPTMSELCAATDPAKALREAKGERIGDLAALLANSVESSRDASRPWLLAPSDLQAVKAAGVTFPLSMIERVIEEKARGDAAAAHGIRAEINRLVGGDLQKLKPGSPEAMALKEALIRAGAWSQYLEVGIGPDAEIFTKARPWRPSASAPTRDFIRSRPGTTRSRRSCWSSRPQAPSSARRSATTSTCATSRDARRCCLGKAKDNNASACLGPFLRFFDETFSLDDVRRMEVRLKVEGEDGFTLDGVSNMAMIARDPADLARQMIGPHHQYPDGALLYCGTMFAPTQDRGAAGQGFTHRVDDLVTISSQKLGALSNRMRLSTECAPWTFGTGALMRNLAGRGLL